MSHPPAETPTRRTGRPLGKLWMLNDVATLYLAHLELLDRKKNTLRVYLNRLTTVQDVFGRERDMRTWTAADRERYIRERKGKVVNRTINFELITLQSAVSLSIEKGKLELKKDLLKIASPLLPIEENEVRSLTLDEMGRLLAAARSGKNADQVELAIAIILDSGLRHRETCQLRIRDIDTKAKIVRVSSQTTKKRKPREIPISDELCALVDSYIAAGHASDTHFFPGAKPGTARHNLQGYVKAAFDAAGLSETVTQRLHAVRKTWATDTAAVAPIHHLQAMAGWKDLKTAQKYIESRPEERRQAMAQVHAKRRLALKSTPTPTTSTGIDPTELRELVAGGMSYDAAITYLEKRRG